MKFDENLRELRKEKGYSQEELAYRLNVTRQTVSKWENGSAMPDLKKLTELAEFFGVSMDELLKLNVEGGREAGSDNSAFEAYVQYTDQRIAALEESRNQETKKKFSVWICLFTAVMLLLFVYFLNYSNEIRNELNSLSNNISYLQNQIYYDNSGRDNYWESKSNDVTVSFLSVDPDKPYIVEAELRYSPSSYAKDSKIYFSVPQSVGGSERLEATENDGEFVLKTDIDITVNGSIYFILDDGEEIVREELDVDLVSLYCYFDGEDYVSPDYSVSKLTEQNGGQYYFEHPMGIAKLYWSGIGSDKIISAEFVVENDGKEIFSEGLKTAQTDDGKYFEIWLSSYTVNMAEAKDLNIFVRATDEFGVVYKYYPFWFWEGTGETGDIPGQSLIFYVEGKGRVEVYPYASEVLE